MTNLSHKYSLSASDFFVLWTFELLFAPELLKLDVPTFRSPLGFLHQGDDNKHNWMIGSYIVESMVVDDVCEIFPSRFIIKTLRDSRTCSCTWVGWVC